MINCVIWQNSAYANPQVGAGGTTVYEISYTDIQGGASGDGNMNQDPLFADPEERDYHLKSQGGRFTPTGQWVLDQTTSPCIDAGNPEAEYDQESAPNGGRLNMGAYGNTVEASRSPFIVAFSVSDQTSHSEAITDSYEVDVSITPSAPSGQGWSVAGYRILEAGQTEPEWSQDAPSTYDIQGAQGIQIHLQAQVKWQKDQAPDQIAVAEATIWYSLWAVITEFFVTDQTSSSKLYTNSSTVDVHLSTLRPENVNITGYAITEDEFEPTTWDSVAPSDYEITGSTGEVTLYAWLKDSNDFVVHTPCTIYYVTQAPAVSSLDFSRFAARYALGS